MLRGSYFLWHISLFGGANILLRTRPRLIKYPQCTCYTFTCFQSTVVAKLIIYNNRNQNQQQKNQNYTPHSTTIAVCQRLIPNCWKYMANVEAGYLSIFPPSWGQQVWMVLKSGLLSPLNLCAVFLKVKVNYSVEETSLRPSRVTTAPARTLPPHFQACRTVGNDNSIILAGDDARFLIQRASNTREKQGPFQCLLFPCSPL